jgi:tyrosine-protein phosphatase non-receptor type 1
LFRIKNIEGGEDRELQHFHYFNWPDFNVPKCPDAFLNFLQVRS